MDAVTYSPVPNKSTKVLLVNPFRDTQRVRERNRSGHPLVWGDDHADIIRQTLLRFREKDFVIGVDCHKGSVQKVTKASKLYPHRAHVMYELKSTDRELRL